MTTEISTQPLKYTRGRNPNSIKNLRPGNPPVDIGKNGYSLTSALKDKLGKPLQEPPVDAPVRDHIAYKTLKGATELVPVAFRETWDRSDGKLADEKPQFTDNSTYNIIVTGDEVKSRFKQLLSGTRPQPVVDDSSE